MANKKLNRLKIVLAEKERTNNWLAENLGKDKATISKWCTNTTQPDLDNLIKISKLCKSSKHLFLSKQEWCCS